MTKYREILRLKSLGFSERNIAHSCGVSRNTVAKVVKKAAEIKLSWWSYVKKKYKLRMTFFHLASILSRQVFAPALIVYSCIVFHTHQAKDIHNDYESLLYYKMSLCTQKQGGMHVYNQIF